VSPRGSRGHCGNRPFLPRWRQSLDRPSALHVLPRIGFHAVDRLVFRNDLLRLAKRRGGWIIRFNGHRRQHD
jgi:hypothetical protein